MNNWRRWWQVAFLTFSDWVTLEGTQESNQEDRVDFTEGCGEFEPIGTARDHLFNDIGAEPWPIYSQVSSLDKQS